MFRFKELYKDAKSICSVVIEYSELLEYYTNCIDKETCRNNDLDKITYYKSNMHRTEYLLKNILETYPGIRAITKVLSGIDISGCTYMYPRDKYLYSLLEGAIEYTGNDSFSMIYLRDLYYIKSVHTVVEDTVDDLFIDIDLTKIDDNFEYSTNNLRLVLEKLDITEPLDNNKIKYISEIYFMIFKIMDCYKSYEMNKW